MNFRYFLIEEKTLNNERFLHQEFHNDAIAVGNKHLLQYTFGQSNLTNSLIQHIVL